MEVIYEGVKCSPLQMTIKLIRQATNGVPSEELIQTAHKEARGSKHYWDRVREILNHWEVSLKKK